MQTIFLKTALAAGLTSIACVPLAMAAPIAVVAEDEQAETPKITDRSHPDYVRCRKERVIGSLAKVRKVCLTNREWANVATDGNNLARTMVDENRSRPGGQ